MNRDDIIILKADKGVAIVIMNTNDYIEEGNRQRNNTEFYPSVDTDTTQANTELINTSIRNFANDKLSQKSQPNHYGSIILKLQNFIYYQKYTSQITLEDLWSTL